MAVKASPISRTAASVIIAVGAFVLLGGIVAGDPPDEVAGAVFIALGLALHGLLLRFTRKLKAEVAGRAG